MYKLICLILFLFLGGCANLNPTTNPYNNNLFLKTRIVIEYKTDDDCKPKEFAVDNQRMTGYLVKLSESFKPGNIYFDYTYYEYIEYNPYCSFQEYSKYEASLFPKELTIYFLFPRNYPSLISGQSRFPWYDNPYGLVIYQHSIYDPYELPHEVGHQLGLFHVFEDEDYVSDTPNQPYNPYYENIMNYTYCESQNFTSGQLQRMRNFLYTSRKNYLFNP